MDPATLALVTAGSTAAIGAVGSYFGQSSANKANLDIANRTNAANAEMAFQNRMFQDTLSRTAWQRGVADMKAAGINPMLLVSKGAGQASTPPGSQATAVTGAAMQNPMAGLPAAISTGLQLATLYADAKKALAEAKLSESKIPEAENKAAVHGVISDLLERVVPKAHSAISSGASSADAVIQRMTQIGSDVERRRQLAVQRQAVFEGRGSV